MTLQISCLHKFHINSFVIWYFSRIYRIFNAVHKIIEIRIKLSVVASNCYLFEYVRFLCWCMACIFLGVGRFFIHAIAYVLQGFQTYHHQEKTRDGELHHNISTHDYPPIWCLDMDLIHRFGKKESFFFRGHSKLCKLHNLLVLSLMYEFLIEAINFNAVNKCSERTYPGKAIKIVIILGLIMSLLTMSLMAISLWRTGFWRIWNLKLLNRFFFLGENRRYYSRIEGLMNEPFSKWLFYFYRVWRQLQIYSLTAMQFGDVSFFLPRNFIVVSMQICFYKLWLFLMSTSRLACVHVVFSLYLSLLIDQKHVHYVLLKVFK